MTAMTSYARVARQLTMYLDRVRDWRRTDPRARYSTPLGHAVPKGGHLVQTYATDDPSIVYRECDHCGVGTFGWHTQQYFGEQLCRPHTSTAHNE